MKEAGVLELPTLSQGWMLAIEGSMAKQTKTWDCLLFLDVSMMAEPPKSNLEECVCHELCIRVKKWEKRGTIYSGGLHPRRLLGRGKHGRGQCLSMELWAIDQRA